MPKRCTCAGIAKGYPQHEASCGKQEPAASTPCATCDHWLQVHDDCPCRHGCDNIPCGYFRCDCEDFVEAKPDDPAEAKYDAEDWARG